MFVRLLGRRTYFLSSRNFIFLIVRDNLLYLLNLLPFFENILSLLYIDLPSKRSSWSTANYVFQSYEAIFFVNANLYHLSRPLIRNVRNEIQSDKYRYLEKQIPVSMLYIYGYIPRSPRISRGRFIRMFRL